MSDAKPETRTYLFDWGGGRKEAVDIAITEPGHGDVIRYAEACSPRPDSVVLQEILPTPSGIRSREETVFQFSYDDSAGRLDPTKTLAVALDEFMAIAFPEGQDAAQWVGPVGLNRAIAQLKFSYERRELGR
jgi:hypothetical protein